MSTTATTLARAATAVFGRLCAARCCLALAARGREASQSLVQLRKKGRKTRQPSVNGGRDKIRSGSVPFHRTHVFSVSIRHFEPFVAERSLCR